MPDHRPKAKPVVHARRAVVDTGVFRVEEMDLEFSNGQRRRYQRVVGSDQGAVLAVPVTDQGELVLVREYAAAMDRYELAFPKGHIEPGESAEAAALREIREETGFAARRLERIAGFTLAPGYLSHTTHVVLARDLYADPLPGDEPEGLEVVPWPLDRLAELLERPDFTEARSVAAFYRVRELLLSGY